MTGYQQARSYRMRQSEEEPGTPVTRMLPRALTAPPGVPDFMTRKRFVAPGRVVLEGRAWSGWGEISRVEVSVDSGRSWVQAVLGDGPGKHAWRGWSHPWAAAEPSDYQLICRAYDTAGNVQPLKPEWNLGGYAINAAQRIAITVAT